MSERSEAWQEGNAAYWDGLSDADNPHPNGSDEAMDWNDGYRYAEESDEG